MKGSVATVSKEQLLSMEDGYGHYRGQKSGICVTMLEVLKIILYVELVLFLAFLFAAFIFNMPRNFSHEDNTSFELDNIYNVNDTETSVLCQLAKTIETSEKVTEVPEMLFGDETTTENDLIELKSLEVQNGTDDSEYHYLRLGPIVFRWSKGDSDESYSVETTDDGAYEQDQVRNNEEAETVIDFVKNLIVNCDECDKQGDSGEEKIHITTSKDEITEMEKPVQTTTPNMEEMFKDKVSIKSQKLMSQEYGTNEYDKPVFESTNYNNYYYDD